MKNSARSTRSALLVFLLVGWLLPGAGLASPPPTGTVLPLLSTEPGAASAPELDALASWIGEARIVGLGEDPHGVHDFHRLAHRLFLHLAETRGFEVYALETDQHFGALLDQFVQGQRDDLDELLAQRWWVGKIFVDEALRSLLLDLREHNRTARKKLHVAGFDHKMPAATIAALLAEVAKEDGRLATELERLYAEVLALGHFGVFPNVAGFTGALPIELPPAAVSRRLTVAARLRASALTFGFAGASAVATGDGGERVFKMRRFGAEELAARSVDLTFELELPPTVKRLRLMLFHGGDGTVWFDGVSAELDGASILPAGGLADFAPEMLSMPKLQAMDYQAAVETGEAGGQVLRVACDPRVTRGLAAARAAQERLRQAVRAAPDRWPPSSALWLEQRARLIVEAVEWRTLAEPNRDVMMAANLAWLAGSAFPNSRILALAHSIHVERIPGRMGGFLAERLGASYRVVTMQALAGESLYFGPVAELGEDPPLVPTAIDAAAARQVGRWAAGPPGDLLVDLRSALGDSLAPEMGTEERQLAERADALVVLRQVRPIEPLPRPEAVSLVGRDLTAPLLPAATRRDFEARLEAAKAELAAHPESAEAWIWVGRRTAYLGRFREAIEIFSQGLARFPGDARFLRHRGHRWLTVRELKKAEEDLAKAARLVLGKPDEIEPDGLPNAAGIPTSTLQSNIHYHLGLARYLQGNFEGALAAYRDDLAGATAAAPNLDREVATRYWLWLTLSRLGREDEAAQVLAPVSRGWKLLENHAYHRLLLLFKGEEQAEALLVEAGKGQGELDFPSISYGVGAWYLVSGNKARAGEVFRKVVEKAPWAAFGALAAEAELARWKPPGQP